MAPEEPKKTRKRRKLGRGLSDISHVFLSGAERPSPESEPDIETCLWNPDVDILSVTSGECVRGKTFLAANLAFGLSLEGYRLALVSADPTRPDIFDVTGAGRPDGIMGPVRSNAGFGGILEADLLGGYGTGPAETDQTASPMQIIDKLAASVQRVVVDTAPQAKPSLSIWKAAGLVLVVTEPNSEGMKSSYLTIKHIHAVSPVLRVGLVVNFAENRHQGDKCFRKLSNVCRRFLKTNLRNYGYIVPSEAVGVVSERAVPLVREYPAHKITKCIDYIVGLIVMDQLAIARRRREVTVKACASREGS
jgi:flagellar biosynthesis protein FlhG